MQEKIMRQNLLVLVLALLVAPVATAAVAEAPVSASATSAGPQALSEDLPAAAEGVGAGDVCSAPVRPEAAAAAESCPFGSPTCREHDDCDAYCGSPEFGYCDIQGFFPTGCCLCLG